MLSSIFPLNICFNVIEGSNSLSFILIPIPGIFPFISILGLFTDTFKPGILPLIFAFISGFLPLKFIFGILILGPFISILPEGNLIPLI